MKKIFSLIAFIFILTQLYSQNIEWNWALQGGGSSWDHGYAIATDQQNNVLIRGKFVSTGYFSDTSISTSDPEEDYLAKYDENGNLIWVRKIGGKASWEKDRSIAIDENNNIYLTGFFNSSTMFDQINLKPNGGYDAYVAKLNKDGDYIWAKQIGSSNNDAGYAIAYSNNKVFVTGFFSDTFSFKSNDFISKGNTDIFIASYDESGNEIWAKSGGSVNEDRGYGIASDNSFVYITGRISGNSEFDGIQLSTIGANDLLISKYDLNGKIIWAKNDGNSGEIESKTIATSNGKIYLTGRFGGSVNFGSLSFNAKGQSDVYIVKYNEDGVVEWADMHSGIFANEGNSIAVKNNRIYIVGVFADEISIGDTNLETNSLRDSYISCYKDDGKFEWANICGANDEKTHLLGNSISIDQSNNIYVGGEYSGSAMFGSNNLNPYASFDMFLLSVKDLKIPSSSPEIQEVPFNIYPNPNNGVFKIESNKEVNISIYDLSGKLIQTKEVFGTSTIDISNQPKGIYLIKDSVNENKLYKIIHTSR